MCSRGHTPLTPSYAYPGPIYAPGLIPLSHQPTLILLYTPELIAVLHQPTLSRDRYGLPDFYLILSDITDNSILPAIH